MAEAPQWARVRGDFNIRLRRGAWYEVVSLTPEQAVVDVNEQQLSVARSFLQIVPLRGQPTEMRCPKCNGVFEIAWDDPF